MTPNRCMIPNCLLTRVWTSGLALIKFVSVALHDLLEDFDKNLGAGFMHVTEDH